MNSGVKTSDVSRRLQQLSSNPKRLQFLDLNKNEKNGNKKIQFIAVGTSSLLQMSARNQSITRYPNSFEQTNQNVPHRIPGKFSFSALNSASCFSSGSQFDEEVESFRFNGRSLTKLETPNLKSTDENELLCYKTDFYDVSLDIDADCSLTKDLADTDRASMELNHVSRCTEVSIPEDRGTSGSWKWLKNAKDSVAGFCSRMMPVKLDKVRSE